MDFTLTALMHIFLHRIESEMVDYSTQYRWMFGVLAILISTGLHPLPDYPAKYEEGRKIRYRSHHIQSLPDSEKVHTCNVET